MADDFDSALESVPDVVGPEPGEVIQEGEGDDGFPELEAMSREEVTELLTELFDWLSEYFESSHWKLTARNQRILGRPLTVYVNKLIQKINAMMPELLAKYCEENPEFYALLIGVTVVVVPKVSKQWAISRARRKQAGTVIAGSTTDSPAVTDTSVKPEPERRT